MTKRELATAVAWKYVSTWYRWGGDDPSGFDCSGLVIELLSSVGIVPNGFDSTAEGLRQLFSAKSVPGPAEGCLVFYGATKATHVAYVIDESHAIGANGGSSKTTDLAAAIRDNAFVKVRPIHYRSDILGYVDPFKT